MHSNLLSNNNNNNNNNKAKVVCHLTLMMPACQESFTMS